jgi:hypothetical protein
MNEVIVALNLIGAAQSALVTPEEWRPASPIVIGMTQSEAIEILGAPDEQKTVGLFKPSVMFSYRGKQCRIKDDSCFVFVQDGKVIEVKNIK